MTQFTHNERCKLRLILCAIFPLAFAKCQKGSRESQGRGREVKNVQHKCVICFPSFSSFLPFLSRQIGEANKSEIRNRTRLMSRHFVGTASLNKWIAISAAWLRCHFRWVSIISCGSVSSGSCRLLRAAWQTVTTRIVASSARPRTLHSTPVLPNPTPFWASSDNDNSLHTLWGASLWGCDGSRASCLPTAIIIRHLNNFRFHAAPLSPGTRRLARFPTLDGYQPPPWQSLRPANPKLCGVCAIFLRPASHIISAHHQHLIATNNAATLGCTLLLLMHEGSLQNGAQREAT